MAGKTIVGLFTVVSACTLEAGEVRVDGFSSSEDCGQTPDFDTIQTTAYDPATNVQGESLRVFFKDFVLNSAVNGRVDKNCVLDAQIRIPAGFRFRPVSATAEGSFSIQPKDRSKGFIKVSYEVEPQGWKAEQSNENKPFTGEGDINCQAELKEAFFLECSNSDTVINLHTNIDLKIRQRGGGFSQMDIDATRNNYDLAWKWELKPCSVPFEDRDFQSYIVAYDGRSVPASLRFRGTTGTFTTSSLTGHFTELRYLNYGRTVQGTWSAGKQRGSFTFKLKDESRGTFKGTWKDAKNPSQGGTWNGRYN